MLQKRLILLLSVLIIVPTLVIGWMAYRFAIDSIRSDRIQVVGQIAASRHEQINRLLVQTHTRANIFLGDLLIKCLHDGALQTDCASGFLQDYLHTEEASGAVLFVEGSGQHLIVGQPPAEVAGSQPAIAQQLAWVSAASAGQPRYFSVMAGDKRSLLQLQVSYAVSQWRPIFALPAELGRSGEVFLVDSQGFVVIHGDPAADAGVLQPIDTRAMRQCLARQSAEMLAEDYRGAAVIHGFRYVPEIGGGCLMVHVDQAEAFAPVTVLERRILLAMLLFVLFSALVMSWLARRIVQPILKLTETARKISHGDLSIRAEVAGDDELAELAHSFNHMTDALADAQRNLEAKVEERTQALLISQERYMLAERAVDDGIWDWNIQNHTYYLSPRWNKILGYAAGELPNRESIFFELIHPDDKARASKVFSQHLQNKARYMAEIRLRHKDGSYRWVLDRGEALRDEHDRPIRMIGSITDITDRKAAEAELINYRDHLEERVARATTEVQAIVQTAVNGVISIDADGSIRVFNPAAERLFGWQAAEIIGQNVAVLMPEPFASAHDGYIRRFLQTEQSHILGIEREVVAKRRDGSEFAANLAVGHGIISEGRHIFVGFIADITLQKQAEQELRLAKEAAEAAAKAKADFLANMSHEIRTPMNTVIGFAEVVQQNPHLPAEVREHVATILNSARHLLNLINDILDFSKIEAGKVELEKVCFNLPFVVQETLQSIGLRALEKGLSIDLQIEPGLPQFFCGDPNRLRQVLLNLVGNAVKFTEVGQIVVRIQTTDQPDLLHFAISDTGIGMTAEQVEKIFESFSQADTTTSRRFGGTGLGTTISKQIVEMMGGQIWVDSQLGQGSTFHFTVHLPATPQQETCLYQDSSQPVADYFSPRSFNVLLAEDIEANAALAELRLHQQGHRVTWVKNGLAAVQAFGRDDYDLILMDLHMPVLDGIQATLQIRALEQGLGRRMPIVALTASVLDDEVQQCRVAGMDAIVGKPIDINELLKKMEQAVPEGRGQLRSAIQVTPLASHFVDLSPMAAVADVNKALKTWQDPWVYAQALRSFAQQYANLQEFADYEKTGLDAFRQALHALKGVAGNLALRTVAACAAAVSEALKNPERADLPERLQGLLQALQAAVLAIGQLQWPTLIADDCPKIADDGKLAELLSALSQALDSLNPEKALPVVLQLEQMLGMEAVQKIRLQIEQFDFDAAKAALQQLSEHLGL